MRNVGYFGVLAALVAGLAGSARAGTKAGVTMPDSVQVEGKRLVLNGMGLREATMLKVDVYVAGLYLEAPSSDPNAIIRSNQPKQLVMRFVRSVHRDDVVKAWNEGFKRNATVPVAQIQSEIDQLNHWMGDMSNGDTVTFTYVPDRGVSVDINGVRKGVLPGEAFASSLFAIWLGPRPPTSDLKSGLLRH